MNVPDDNDLPPGVQDYPAPGWPLMANISEFRSVPVKVGQISVPQTFHNVIGPGPDDPHDPDWIVTLMYAVEDGSIVLAAAMAGGEELPDALERLRSLRPLRWWQRRTLRAVVADEALRAIDMMEVAEQTEPETPAPLDVSAVISGHRDWLAGYFGSTVDQRRAWYRDQIREADRTPLGRRRGRITREHLEEVATVYRNAWETGAAPTAAVAAHFNRPHSTAADWVLRARREGVLGQADGTRGGER